MTVQTDRGVTGHSRNPRWPNSKDIGFTGRVTDREPSEDFLQTLCLCPLRFLTDSLYKSFIFFSPVNLRQLDTPRRDPLSFRQWREWMSSARRTEKEDRSISTNTPSYLTRFQDGTWSPSPQGTPLYIPFSTQVDPGSDPTFYEKYPRTPTVNMFPEEPPSSTVSVSTSTRLLWQIRERQPYFRLHLVFFLVLAIKSTFIVQGPNPDVRL